MKREAVTQPLGQKRPHVHVICGYSNIWKRHACCKSSFGGFLVKAEAVFPVSCLLRLSLSLISGREQDTQEK